MRFIASEARCMNDEDLLNALTSLPGNDNYNAQDRYRDFRKVFMESEEGKRVLSEILAWGRLLLPPSMGSPVDPLMMAIQEGQRNIVRKLLVTINHDPPVRPGKQTR